MKLSSLILFAAFAAAAPLSRSTDVRLITYNIRLAPKKPQWGEELWPVRRPRLTAQINYETSGRPESIVCMQEALYPQIQDIQQDLGSEWDYYGIGRRGGQSDEFSPIFYRPSVWNIEDKKTYWLSDTPEKVGSRGWDAAFPRIVTVARFQHTATGNRMVYMCTHFDHKGKKARANSAKLITDIAENWSIHDGETIPVFIGGDLNSSPSGAAYKHLAKTMNDVKSLVPQSKRYGHSSYTYTGFTTVPWDDMYLDHIFVHDPTGIEFKAFAVVNSRYEDGVFISDHRPVVVDVRLNQVSRKQRRTGEKKHEF
ncbi:endonuclease exonuclease phosphatase [Fusarium globosum]|uniref:Endonuclease exonuclease phosphatase n=1 Tax=Fusarium globosum TaxID=78864 RepID=A0A8H6DL35_9HYPO|nr:endonuclease exonuclease phosphatase [Fusarium globosum]